MSTRDRETSVRAAAIGLTSLRGRAPRVERRASAALRWAADYSVAADDDAATNGLASLYDKAKRSQWNAATDLDWSAAAHMADRWVARPEATVLGTTLRFMGRDEDARRRAVTDEIGYAVSQILHGEQGAMAVASRLVAELPDLDAKLLAASQAGDEARHVEVFARCATLLVGEPFPIHEPLARAMESVASASSWFHRVIGLQIVFEGMALADFAALEGAVEHPVLVDAVRRVRADEARHAAFGVHSLRRHLGALTEAEREELAEFGLHLISDLLRSTGQGMVRTVGPRHGIDPDALLDRLTRSPRYAASRRALLSQAVVPNLAALGLVTDRVRGGYEALGLRPAESGR